MADYDRGFLEGEAANLLARAKLLALAYAAFTTVIGAAAGGVGAAAGGAGEAVMMGAIVGAGAGFVMGAFYGDSKARGLRLQAHTLLVQVEIERHLATLVARLR